VTAKSASSSDWRRLTVMPFGEDTALPDRVRCVYRIGVNFFNGTRTPQLIVARRNPA